MKTLEEMEQIAAQMEAQSKLVNAISDVDRKYEAHR